MDDKKVLNLLKNHKEGLTIQDISQKLNFSRTTVSRIIAYLDGAKKIKIRPVGKAKLIYLL